MRFHAVFSPVPVLSFPYAGSGRERLLQPQALYSVYKTEVLEKGEYIFATLICFTTDGNIQTSPEVIINNDAVTVNQGDFLKIIEVG